MKHQILKISITYLSLVLCAKHRFYHMNMVRHRNAFFHFSLVKKCEKSEFSKEFLKNTSFSWKMHVKEYSNRLQSYFITLYCGEKPSCYAGEKGGKLLLLANNWEPGKSSPLMLARTEEAPNAGELVGAGEKP